MLLRLLRRQVEEGPEESQRRRDRIEQGALKLLVVCVGLDNAMLEGVVDWIGVQLQESCD